MKIRIILIGILLLALFLRFWRIGDAPYGIANDEINYLYSAYHLWETGQDIHGNSLPLSFQVDSSLSPVPIYLIAPIVGLFGPSAVSGRLLHGLLSIGTILITYLLCKRLFKDENVALLSSLFLAVSQWYIVISRGAWDGGMALFFLLLGIYIFIRNVEKGSVLWSIPFFLLGFYSYHATKVFFIAVVCVLLGVYFHKLKAKKTQFLLFLALSIGIVLSFFITMSFYKVNRQEAIIFNDASYIKNASKTVDFERRTSSGSEFEKKLFNNKGWFYLTIMVDQYLGAFSPQYLFTTGDINPIVGWGTYFKGALYLIDFPFLLLGFVALYNHRKRREAIFVVLCLLIAPLPSTVGAGKTYSIRSLMMLPFLAIIIAHGLVYVSSFFSHYALRYRNGIKIGICIIYSLFILRFIYQYHHQFVTYGSEYWNASTRLMGDYIHDNKDKFDKIYIVNAPESFLLNYGFLHKVDPRKIQNAWATRAPIDNIIFTNECLHNGKGDPYTFLDEKTMYIVPGACYLTTIPDKSFANPQENLEVYWKIYEKL